MPICSLKKIYRIKGDNIMQTITKRTLPSGVLAISLATIPPGAAYTLVENKNKAAKIRIRL
jgi:hypothetical protein